MDLSDKPYNGDPAAAMNWDQAKQADALVTTGRSLLTTQTSVLSIARMLTNSMFTVLKSDCFIGS